MVILPITLLVASDALDVAFDAGGICREAVPVHVVGGPSPRGDERWFGQTLAALDESEIEEELLRAHAALRLLVSFAKGDDPAVIRVDFFGRTATVTVKVGSAKRFFDVEETAAGFEDSRFVRTKFVRTVAMGEWFPFELTRNETREISGDEIAELEKALAATHVRDDSRFERWPTDMIDFDEWFFEYVDEKHSVSTVADFKPQALEHLAQIMMNLAEVHPAPRFETAGDNGVTPGR
jgi:hypothetical protein